MPQASENLRSLMERWFGDPIDEIGPLTFLLTHGWLEQSGMMKKPTPSYTPSIYEIACLKFLHDEWDFAWEGPLFESIPGAE